MNMSLRTGRRSLAATAVALLLASGAVACSGDGKPAADDKVTEQSATSQDSAAGTSADNGSSGDDDGVAYAACMRKNGVDVADPKPGDPPQLPEGVAQSLLEKAEQKCGKPPGTSSQAGGGEFADDPKLEELSIKNMKCLRENGYEVPDSKSAQKPKLEGEDPVLDRAKKACKASGDALTEYIRKIMGDR
ncbi:hypothetical protein ACFZAV_27385 [Streptomyces sp. NPDC008343]|uniref:hypothetical protein n=1 Tax=Streptomyces sp. NPDC008343 TaxID=3364828 RepID=UPI0036EFB187